MRIYVGNLSYRTTEENLESTFAAYGTVRDVSIMRDRQTGKSRGFGFVEMEEAEEGSAAVDGLNGTQLDGRTLTVNEARPRASGSDHGGSEGRGNRRW